jgi:selenocysteine-specific elongation factor
VRSIVIGTAGHIDHGKSALVRALTGTDPDRLKEEQERGITIDLGFAHCDVDRGRDRLSLSFVDVPGHERFVKNMLAGAGGIDLVLLVVAADEAVMPQTREHFQICRLLRVRSGVVVLTKNDLVEPEMLQLAADDVREMVRGSFLAEAPIVPVSARTGQGLDRLLDAIAAVADGVPPRRTEGPTRLPIDRVFTAKGFGTILTGTLVSGTIAEDQELVVLPRPRAVKVRGLQVHGQRTSEAGAGRRVAVNAGGIDVGDVVRGDTLCVPAAFQAVTRIDAALEVLPEAAPLKHGIRVRVHAGTAEVFGRVAIAGPRDANEPGSIYARIRLETPAVLTRGDRFIIRSYSPLVTIGGGVVLDPSPPRGALRSETALARFRRLDSIGAEPDTAVLTLIEERGGTGLPREDLQWRVGLTSGEADAVARRLASAGLAIDVGGRIVDPGVLGRLREALVRLVREHHAANPLSDGLPREEARERVFRRLPSSVSDFVVEQAIGANAIAGRERLAVAGHRVSLTPEEERVRASLERTYREAGLTPPDLAAAAAAAGAPAALAERMVALLVRSRALARIDTLYFHVEALEGLKTEVRALKGAGAAGAARVDVGAFKERYGVTRKFAIPLLEYLDRERVTRRVGEARIVL